MFIKLVLFTYHFHLKRSTIFYTTNLYKINTNNNKNKYKNRHLYTSAKTISKSQSIIKTKINIDLETNFSTIYKTFTVQISREYFD